MKLLKKSHSQSGQESFVLAMLEYKGNGTYLEVGAWDGIDLSNTFLLEKKYGWKGIAIDINEDYVDRYNKKRKNLCLHADALATDYKDLLNKFNFPDVIDYLQLDIEPAENTFNCLRNIPLDSYKFRTITFEHDLYASAANLTFKNQAFEYLTAYGYKRVASNVQNQGNPYEDWYVYPALIDSSKRLTFEPDVDFIQHFDH